MRANHNPINPKEYIHSNISLELRKGVIESEYLFQASLAYMSAFGSLHAHPNADVEKGSTQVTNMYFNALADIPYLTGGKSGDEVANEDRMKAVEAFKKMRAETLGKKR